MAKLYNLARMTTATTGAGTITLGAAATGHLTFAQAGVQDGETVTYAIEDGGHSEIGRGDYTASGTTLTRSVLKSTNSDSPINLSGSAQVFITVAKEDILNAGENFGDLLDPSTARRNLLKSIGLGTINISLSAAVASNALTISIKTQDLGDPAVADPATVGIRNETASTGDYSIRDATAALSVTLPNGATAGVPANNRAFRIWVVLFDDGGTLRPALINCLGTDTVYPLAAWQIASSTATGTGSGAAKVFYSDVAVSSKPYAIIGYLEWASGLPAIGAWSTGPTRVQLMGPGVLTPGTVLTIGYYQTGAYASGPTTVPIDNTIMQQTEGTQFMSLTVTPQSAADLLRIDVGLNGFSSTAGFPAACGLFRDSGADALAAVIQPVATSGGHQMHRISHVVLAGSAAATAFKVRAGAFTGGPTFYFNGGSSSQEFAGTHNSYIQVSEIVA